MMDHFGIGAAMKAMALNYTYSARRTGRTTSLVESVKDGDRIVFAERREADRVGHLCLERGVKVECIVIDPRDPGRVMERRQPEGRTIFDHSWVEIFYMRAIEAAAGAIDHLERETSGYGEAHRETKRCAEELARWR
jgi:hypothetical protein